MSKIVVAVDPGTINTGYCKLEVNNDGTVAQVHEAGIIKATGKRAVDRIPEIIDRINQLVEKPASVDEIWTELFVPYGARKGAMWNASLVGAILFLPVTRMIKGLSCYGVYPVQWKAWIKRQSALDSMKLDTEFLLELDNVTLTDEQSLALSNPHVADALGLALFGIKEAEQHEYRTC
jgi:Holliday junction resolvasome RuvABC endonuclease subunit